MKYSWLEQDEGCLTTDMRCETSAILSEMSFRFKTFSYFLFDESKERLNKR